MNYQIRELRERSDKLTVQAQAKIQEADEIRSADGAKAKELEASADRMLDEAQDLFTRAERAERAENHTRALNAADPRRQSENRTAEATDDEKRHHDVFCELLIRSGDLNSMTAEDRALITRAQSTTVAADGGFTLPTAVNANVLRRAIDFGPMLDPEIFDVRYVANGSPIGQNVSNSARKARLIAENTAANVVDAKLEKITLSAFKLTTDALVASRELFEDGQGVEEWLTGELAESFGLGANEYLTVGTGAANAPTGIVTALSANAQVSAATGGVTAEELLELQYGVNSAYRRRGRYMISSVQEKNLRKLKDGQGNFAWAPGMQAGEAATLFGRGYIINDDMPDLATAPTGKVAAIFGDFKSYRVHVSRRFGITPLKEMFALSDQLGWVGFGRIDGNVIQKAGLRALKVK